MSCKLVINLLVRDVIPAILVKPVAIFLQGLKNSHTMSDKNSHIFKHFSESPSCKSLFTPCFTILDPANTPIDLKLKEALHINKNKPNLNKQVHHFNTFLAF